MEKPREQTGDPSLPGEPPIMLLALGALVGLIFAAVGLLETNPPASPLPADAVARVDDTVISLARLERATAQLAASLGRQPDQAERARVLQQLIDEELLLQRGVDLELPRSDTTVRTAIVQSMVASVTAEADAADPDDAVLEGFLADNAARYTFASAMTLDAWTAENEADARGFLDRLTGDPDAEPDDRLQSIPGLPDSAAPLERLRMFVGPAIAAAAADMPVGSSAVFARQGRWYVVRVVNREESVIADLDSIRSQVLLDYRRSLADAALRDYLDNLRQLSNVQVLLPD